MLPRAPLRPATSWRSPSSPASASGPARQAQPAPVTRRTLGAQVSRCNQSDHQVAQHGAAPNQAQHRRRHHPAGSGSAQVGERCAAGDPHELLKGGACRAWPNAAPALVVDLAARRRCCQQPEAGSRRQPTGWAGVQPAARQAWPSRPVTVSVTKTWSPLDAQPVTVRLAPPGDDGSDPFVADGRAVTVVVIGRRRAGRDDDAAGHHDWRLVAPRRSRQPLSDVIAVAAGQGGGQRYTGALGQRSTVELAGAVQPGQQQLMQALPHPGRPDPNPSCWAGTPPEYRCAANKIPHDTFLSGSRRRPRRFDPLPQPTRHDPRRSLTTTHCVGLTTGKRATIRGPVWPAKPRWGTGPGVTDLGLRGSMPARGTLVKIGASGLLLQGHRPARLGVQRVMSGEGRDWRS
jgi:hypothetical protein